MKNIVEEVRKFVEEESKKPEAWWGDEFYDLHLVKVHEYAKILAKKLGVDLEIVEMAAWMHDIGSSVYGRKDHHITGAKIAEKKLKELGYPQDKIEKVKHCILAHRGSNSVRPETTEAKIVADADAMAAFDHIHGPFTAALVYEKRSQSSARDSVREKYVNSWNKLNFEESKFLIKPKFEAIKLLLK